MKHVAPPDSQEPLAAVTVIFCQENHSYLLLERVRNPRDPWSGHLAFPGGRRESSDQDLLATAMRECREECGLALLPEQMQQSLPAAAAGKFLGKKPLWVQPFVFEIAAVPELSLQTTEIRAAYWLDQIAFQDKNKHQSRCLVPFSEEKFPCFPVEQSWLWGFTYAVLYSFEFGCRS